MTALRSNKGLFETLTRPITRESGQRVNKQCARDRRMEVGLTEVADLRHQVNDRVATLNRNIQIDSAQVGHDALQNRPITHLQQPLHGSDVRQLRLRQLSRRCFRLRHVTGVTVIVGIVSFEVCGRVAVGVLWCCGRVALLQLWTVS